MKYMGSKRYMLKNGLGDLICDQSKYCQRIVDLFCGAASISWFAAQETSRQVIATDLQNYSIILARAVIGRTKPIDPKILSKKWIDVLETKKKGSRLWVEAKKLEQKETNLKKYVEEARILCEATSKIGPIWNVYGGYYFSPSQSLTLDFMIKYLPNEEPEKSICLSSLLFAASKCAASPGHTAQPFRPTNKSGKYLKEAWKRNPLYFGEKALNVICSKYANVVGNAFVSDAVVAAETLKSDDLVVVDPPYSEVQYSRFYHVLETITRGDSHNAEGAGRYPPIEDRPQSDFCKRSKSKNALENLISNLANARTTIIFTFPMGECTNGLSGKFIIETAKNRFNITKKVINGRFSTLGGNNSYRASRKFSNELLLLMKPK